MTAPPTGPSPSPSPFPDVVVVGGGAVGSSIAYFLAANPDFRGRVTVVERDHTYARASSALSVGGIRQQFSTPENIRMSLFSAAFLRQAPERLEVEGERPDVGFVEAGYLFLATDAGLPTLERNVALQRSLGAEVALLSPAALKERFPWLRVDDLAAGSLGLRNEGWLDPYSLLTALRRKARALGAEYRADEVVGMERRGRRLEAVLLASGERLPCGVVVNAAGPWAAVVARMAGIPDLPVHPRRRIVYRFRCAERPGPCPLVIDPSGVYFRPEGPDYLGGVSPPPESDPDTEDLTVEYDLFQDVVWPTLARRVPAFDALRLGPSWAGLYAVNPLDRNAILGPHPEVENLFLAVGFSGHGLQQAPAVGLTLSERIVYGEYRTLDLQRMEMDRFERGELLTEGKVV